MCFPTKHEDQGPHCIHFVCPCTQWCGEANRHGNNCVLEIKPVYPAQDVFSKLRSLARLFGTPVLLVYGRPDQTSADGQLKKRHSPSY